MHGDFKKHLLIALVMVLTCGLALAQSHTLAQTYIDAGYYTSGLLIPANTITAVGPVVDVNCPGKSGTCTIQADQFIQETAGTTTGNEFSIGFYLDGKPAIDVQSVGETPSDLSSLMGVTQEYQAKVPLGSHTVQIFVESQYGCYVANYSTTFRVYRP